MASLERNLQLDQKLEAMLGAEGGSQLMYESAAFNVD